MRFLVRSNTVSVNVDDALEPLVADKYNEINHMDAALLVYFEVVDRTLAFVDTDDFAS